MFASLIQNIYQAAETLLEKAKRANEAGEDSEAAEDFRKAFDAISDLDAYGVLRELHVRSHLEEIEKEANALTTPREQIKGNQLFFSFYAC